VRQVRTIITIIDRQDLRNNRQLRNVRRDPLRLIGGEHGIKYEDRPLCLGATRRRQ